MADEVLHCWRMNAKYKNRGVKITISTSCFIPKPHSPFQWEAQISIEEYLRRVNLLRSSITARNVSYNWHDAETSLIEAVLSRADRRVADAIEEVWRQGGRLDSWSDYFSFQRWMDAFEKCGVDTEFYANRERSVDEALPWLKRHPVNEVYCCLSTDRYLEEIFPIMDYCENNFVRFYYVPNLRNYMKRAMNLELLGNVPILYIREEPLRQVSNRFVKRAFDVTVSGVFLCTLFPFVYLFVALGIKLTSKGPVFFIQERSGENGRTFGCIKFRSMRVNDEADRVQATKNDPRKTRFGSFLRKSSIDELPQFINVLKGEMSIVGPRPHMLQHTELYSKLVNKYMVRHLIKPGITGWAQVTGYRGETHELSQMEGRVRRDIWYLENWSLLLDIRIMLLTVWNALKRDENAY